MERAPLWLGVATQHAVFDRLGAESGRVMFEMFF
jgi:hypothetical protein